MPGEVLLEDRRRSGNNSDPAIRGGSKVIDGDNIRRVRHRHRDLFASHPQRQRPAAMRQRGRHRPEGFGVGMKQLLVRSRCSELRVLCLKHESRLHEGVLNGRKLIPGQV